MTRRNAIIAAAVATAGAKSVAASDILKTKFDTSNVRIFELIIKNARPDQVFLKIEVNGKTVSITTKEVMDALDNK